MRYRHWGTNAVLSRLPLFAFKNMEAASAGFIPASFKLSARPKQIVSQKHNETVELQPERLQTLMYITECSKCEMILKKKAVKVVVDGCQDLVLTLCCGLISGTIEVFKSSNISLNVEKEVKVSTITADSTTGLQITLFEDEKQLESVYSHLSFDLSVMLGAGETRKEFGIVQPQNDPENLQFISYWAIENGGVKLVTEKVVRDGCYPYAETALKQAREKDKQNAEKAFSTLEKMFFEAKKK